MSLETITNKTHISICGTRLQPFLTACRRDMVLLLPHAFKEDKAKFHLLWDGKLLYPESPLLRARIP